MPKLFISYRRADSRKDAGRIYDRLVQAFGRDNIFKDVDNIPLGEDFRAVLADAVAGSDALLAIIGKQWLSAKDADGQRRLENPDDFVRVEIESALMRRDCLVIPILVDNATMPDADDLPPSLCELAFKNATVVRDDPDFHNDVGKIIRELQREHGESAVETTPPPAVSASYDVHAAINDFYRACDAKQWDEGRRILAEIRESGQAPRFFDVDAVEKEVWQAIETETRDQHYESLRQMARRSGAELVWKALQIFWEDFPDYDPDHIAEAVRPRPKPKATPSKKRTTAPPQVIAKTAADHAARVRDVIGAPFDWCEVPGGPFTYGGDHLRLPQRQINLPTFAIAKYPITYGQFEVFRKANDGFRIDRWWQGLPVKRGRGYSPGMQKWPIDAHPRENVSWFDAIAFCRWLSARLGGGYTLSEVNAWTVRLPTEFEWEKAARGTSGRIYPYGNRFDVKKCNTEESARGTTTPVTEFQNSASPYGVVDMQGNVWEWCLSSAESPVPDPAAENLHTKVLRVLRGGSWYLTQSNFRDADPPDTRNSSRGFRVLLNTEA